MAGTTFFELVERLHIPDDVLFERDDQPPPVRGRTLMPQKKYMLDTNMVSFLIKKESESVAERMRKESKENICISSIVAGEILHGLAKKPEAITLSAAMKRFLLSVDILPWNFTAAQVYGGFRAACEAEGKSLSAHDMLIAAHSIASGSVLVSNDKSFRNVAHLLALEDWAEPIHDHQHDPESEFKP